MTLNKTTLDVMMAYQAQAVYRKDKALQEGHNAPIPHDLWRRLIPIACEFERGNADIATLYTYLLAYTNGSPGNDRYMSAFTSVKRIADETRIGRNRVAHLSDVLEAVGLLRTCYDYAGNKRDKLYYPMYSSDLSDDEIRCNLRDLYDKKR